MALPIVVKSGNRYVVIVRLLNDAGKLVHWFRSSPMCDKLAQIYFNRMNDIYAKHVVTVKQFVSLRSAA